MGQRLWFETLRFRFAGLKGGREHASRRISEKQGMRMVGTEEQDYVSGRLPAEIWEITAEEWRAWKTQRWPLVMNGRRSP